MRFRMPVSLAVHPPISVTYQSVLAVEPAIGRAPPALRNRSLMLSGPTRLRILCQNEAASYHRNYHDPKAGPSRGSYIRLRKERSFQPIAPPRRCQFKRESPSLQLTLSPEG